MDGAFKQGGGDGFDRAALGGGRCGEPQLDGSMRSWFDLAGPVWYP